MMITKLMLRGLLLCSISVAGYGQVPDTAKGSAKANMPTVYVKFSVDTSGKIGDLAVQKIKCKGCSDQLKENFKAEALRVVSGMADWKPSKAKQYFIVPIKFDTADIGTQK